MQRPDLSNERILAWADAHHKRTGSWPTVNSGRITGAREERWRSVDKALREGYRGLRGGSSLAQLLEQYRAVPNIGRLPPLSSTKILRWADAQHRRTGDWPNEYSGPIPEAPGENWGNVSNNLRRGYRGLSGGTSLPRLLAQRRGVRNLKALPRLTVKQILAWADRHYRRTGAWPHVRSGPIVGAPGETWSGVETALTRGYRGLKGGTSLYRLLRQHRRMPSR